MAPTGGKPASGSPFKDKKYKCCSTKKSAIVDVFFVIQFTIKVV